MWQRALNSSGSGGGGDNTVYNVSGTLAANALLNVNITGTAHAVFLIDSRGYMDTNVNPSTFEVSDSEMYEITVSDPDGWRTVSNNHFVRTNGNIASVTKIGSSSLDYTILYTME